MKEWSQSLVCLFLSPQARSLREDCESSTEHADSYCKSMIILGSLVGNNRVAIMRPLLRLESRSVTKIES